MKTRAIQLLLSFAGLLGFGSCNSQEYSSAVVQNFELNKYLGTWYEIARYDHSFERGMTHVTATYSLRPDAKVKVLNRGYKTSKAAWSESEGKAKFENKKDRGSLRVSFFGPFYAPYKIVKLDKDYKYALIVSKGTDYLWILSREKKMPDNIRQEYLNKAKELNFDLSKLIWVEQH